MTTSAQRFYIRSPDGRMIVGFDDLNAAGAVALDYGEGAHLVDTNARAYHPIAQEASDGELVYVQIGGWGAGKFSVERNLIESIKKGHVASSTPFLPRRRTQTRRTTTRRPRCFGPWPAVRPMSSNY